MWVRRTSSLTRAPRLRFFLLPTLGVECFPLPRFKVPQNGGAMRFPTLIVVFCLAASFAFADEGHDHKLSEEEVGSVHFATSCSTAVQQDFNRAVALLHSFQYEDTRHAFEQISARDPQCAMAQWGIAMSHYHGLWDNGDMPAGRAAIR